MVALTLLAGFHSAEKPMPATGEELSLVQMLVQQWFGYYEKDEQFSNWLQGLHHKRVHI